MSVTPIAGEIFYLTLFGCGLHISLSLNRSVYDGVTGNRISLIEKYDGSVANPAIRRCELMTRIRGFENICNELGYVGEFYTLTAPSKFHATTKAGYRNSRWNGASPAETQRYLTGL